jgi:hypothetical protein
MEDNWIQESQATSTYRRTNLVLTTLALLSMVILTTTDTFELI